MHKPRKQNHCSRRKLLNWLEHLNDCEPSLVVPVGPQFQANVPEWKGPRNEEFGCRGGASLDDSRWLGTRTWPIQESCVGAKGGKIGKGRSDSCSCISLGSLDCIKRHVAEERKRLHSNLGPAFRRWKFDEMGEDVSKSWTMEQKKKFNSLVRTNPVSQGSSFLDPATAFFSSKTQKDVLSYYLNVYLPKRISMKSHLGFKVLDSDDDEAGDATDDTNRPKRSRSSGLDVGKHVRPMTPTSEAIEAEENRGVEPTIDVSAKLPRLAIQIYSPTIISLTAFEEPEVKDGAETSLTIEIQTGVEDHTEAAEPPTLDFAAPAPEAKAKVSVVQETVAERPEEPEVPRDDNTSGSSLVAQLQEVVGDLRTLIIEVAQVFAELKASRALVEDNKRLEAKFVEAKGKIASLEGTLKFQQVKYKLLRDRNIQLEEVLRTSVRAADIAPLLEGKYWDGINLCRRVMRLLSPQFPIAIFDPRNASATCMEDLYGLRGRNLPPSPSMPGPSSRSETPRQSGSSRQVEPPGHGG